MGLLLFSVVAARCKLVAIYHNARGLSNRFDSDGKVWYSLYILIRDAVRFGCRLSCLEYLAAAALGWRSLFGGVLERRRVEMMSQFIAQIEANATLVEARLPVSATG